MSENEEIREKLRKLHEDKNIREKEYVELKGMLEGIRLAELDKETETFLKVLELMMKGFKGVLDYITSLYEQQVHMGQKINSLEKEVNELRKTLDTLHEYK